MLEHQDRQVEILKDDIQLLSNLALVSLEDGPNFVCAAAAGLPRRWSLLSHRRTHCP